MEKLAWLPPATFLPSRCVAATQLCKVAVVLLGDWLYERLWAAFTLQPQHKAEMNGPVPGTSSAALGEGHMKRARHQLS